MTDLPNHTFADHIRRTLILAWPVMLARVGLVGFTAADVAILGRAGAEELADYSLGLSIYDSLLATLVGLLMGVGVLTARVTGAGQDQFVGLIWRRGLVYGTGMAVALAVALQWSEGLYLLLEQTPERAAGASSVTRIVALGLPFVAIFVATSGLLEALHNPKIGMIAVGLANLSNIALNIVFVFGAGPIPAMGAEGAAYATVINNGLLAVGLVVYTRYWMPERDRYAIVQVVRDAAPTAGEQRKIGFAAGMSYAFEAGSFVMMTLFVGWLGTLALAVNSVIFTYLALTFMVSFGLATATQVRVGNAWGRNDPRGMMMAGWTGLVLSLITSALFAVLYIAAPEGMLRLFTNDPAILTAAVPVMLWMTLALLFDGSQSVMSHACRGRGDTWVPTAMHLVSYWVIMVPLAYWLAIALEHGVSGVYQAIAIASVFSVSVLAIRFYVLTRRV